MIPLDIAWINYIYAVTDPSTVMHISVLKIIMFLWDQKIIWNSFTAVINKQSRTSELQFT